MHFLQPPTLGPGDRAAHGLNFPLLPRLALWEGGALPGRLEYPDPPPPNGCGIEPLGLSWLVPPLIREDEVWSAPGAQVKVRLGSFREEGS